MTRKEKEKILLDGLGLKVGDKIRLTLYDHVHYLEIEENEENYSLLGKNEDGEYRYGAGLVMTDDFVKLKEPIKYKDLHCSLKLCDKCPLNYLIHDTDNDNNTVQEMLNKLDFLDDEEREFYQNRINREYKEKY